MSMFRNIKDSITNLIDKYKSKDRLDKKNVGYRYIQAPVEMGESTRQIEPYDMLTGEAISTENKVYAQVWSPQAVEKLREAYRRLGQ